MFNSITKTHFVLKTDITLLNHRRTRCKPWTWITRVSNNNNSREAAGEAPGASWMTTLLKTFNPVWEVEEERTLVALITTITTTTVTRSTSGTTLIFDPNDGLGFFRVAPELFYVTFMFSFFLRFLTGNISDSFDDKRVFSLLIFCSFFLAAH